MSTDATSPGKSTSKYVPLIASYRLHATSDYCRGNTAKPTSAKAVDKGKGKGRVEGVKDEDGEDEDDDEEGEDVDEDDEDEEMDSDDDDETDDDDDEIDPSAIMGGRRTRGAKVDYTSPEALSKAGLKPEGVEEEDEEPFAH